MTVMSEFVKFLWNAPISFHGCFTYIQNYFILQAKISYSHAQRFSLWKSKPELQFRATHFFLLSSSLSLPNRDFSSKWTLYLHSFTSGNACGVHQPKPCEILRDAEQWHEICFAVHRCRNLLVHGMLRSIATDRASHRLMALRVFTSKISIYPNPTVKTLWVKRK